MTSTDTAKLVGIGLLAGLAGTIVMTLGQKAEMKVTGREGSTTPAEAVEKVADTDVPDKRDEERLSTAVHFGYGTALGAGIALLDRLPAAARAPLFFAAAWGSGMALLNALGLSKPPTQMKPQELAVDGGHHLVYAVAATGAYSLLKRAVAKA